jgi:hypothetical protein
MAGVSESGDKSPDSVVGEGVAGVDSPVDLLDELTPIEEMVVAARANGRPHRAVGELIGQSERTARRHASKPIVAEAIRRRQREHAGDAVGQLGALLPDAIGTLAAGLGFEKDSDRLRAANSIVSSFLKVRDRVEVDEVLAESRDLMRLLAPRDGDVS